MTDVWSGSILFDEPRPSIQDVNLSSWQAAFQATFSSTATLRFLSVVDVQKIPLYLGVGSSLEVSTDNEESSNWLNDVILTQKEASTSDGSLFVPWWEKPQRQSDLGILLKIEGQTKQKKAGYQATEILLYAAAKPKDVILPTPPRSFSPSLLDQVSSEAQNRDDVILELHALPLSSEIISHARQASGLCSPPPEGEDAQGKARFLPDLAADQSRLKKRQRISSLFEDAKKHRKRKSRGGESVAQAMASLDRPASQQGLTAGFEAEKKNTVCEMDVAPGTRATLSRPSRSGSFGGIDHQRPVSRSGAFANGKRSSLHRVESAFSPQEGSLASDLENKVLEGNKAALSKIVMAGIRLHGLQQKKKPAKGLTKSHGAASGIGTDADDEYKLVYHQTFKAAMFTFRAHFSIKVVGQEIVRDVVDRLLAIICTDPLSMSEQGLGFAPSFGSNQPDETNPFDQPSSSAPVGATETAWTTPNVKRRRLDSPEKQG